VPWRIDFEGEVYREGDLTLEQCGQVERLTDRSWLHIQPIRFAGDGIAIIAVMHHARKGERIEDIIARVGSLKPEQYLGMIRFEDEDDLPTEYRDGFPPMADEPTTGT
jgi:hypothetical protein